jgi:hypothetical protein
LWLRRDGTPSSSYYEKSVRLKNVVNSKNCRLHRMYSIVNYCSTVEHRTCELVVLHLLINVATPVLPSFNSNDLFSYSCN